MALATVAGTISDLDLKVAPHKTEAVYFHDGSRGAPPENRLMVDGVRVHVGPTIKYLDLTLDGRWDFRAHFRNLAPRVRKAALALARLMQIQRDRLLATAQGKNLMRQALRAVAMRAIRGFRSVAYMAATTLVGSPPVELLAEERCILYWRNKEFRERGEATTGELRALRSQLMELICKPVGGGPRVEARNLN
ncbi:uncharacterized protein LOC112589073 [Harpegnathos saltator]|uniref:uncharacterized protein LOC112589073 n=1 Tax=Harpegnathos saltator TaxID=610380 RepID=UPI000DBEE8D8|nr:uncharacterized protein LOC112589073 [Harpegnathos saltator]